MATEQVWSLKSYELPLEEIHKLAPDIQWKYLPVIAPTLSPVEACQIIGEWYRACSSDARRVKAGQFFTPSTVAHYMANITGEFENGMHILDPGAGVGILTSAICEKALQQKINKIFITGYESDPVLYVLCRWMLTRTQDILNEHGIDISIELYQHDFVEAIGLAAFLNSSLVDRYFRIISGNTQVSATELRNLPLPSQEQVVRIGKQITQLQGEQDLEATGRIIIDTLGQDLVVGDEEDIQLPIMRDSRTLKML